VFYARIRGKHYKTGVMLERKAMVYVIEGDICLLSRKTLKDLGCLPDGFPRIGEFLETAKMKFIEPVDAADGQDGEDNDQTLLQKRARSVEQLFPRSAVRQPHGECDPESARREFVNPPDQLPMPATTSNRKALEESIKEHYKMSAFNLCKRQHWPVTAGPPMKIHTALDAVPTYHRKPTRVPLHFTEEVRAGLEADVKKGILERVHVGEADT
jgi:hypothetical protein